MLPSKHFKNALHDDYTIKLHSNLDTNVILRLIKLTSFCLFCLFLDEPVIKRDQIHAYLSYISLLFSVHSRVKAL